MQRVYPRAQGVSAYAHITYMLVGSVRLSIMFSLAVMNDLSGDV